MATNYSRNSEQAGREWLARPLRPIARWSVVDDETGRARLRMTWSVPEVTASTITWPAGAGNSAEFPVGDVTVEVG